LGENRWLPFFDILSRNFTVYVPAHPGFAGSEGLERIDTFHDMVFHYADLLDEMGLEKPHIVGLSLGGWIAAEVAVHYAHRVGKLVLIDAMGGLKCRGTFHSGYFRGKPERNESSVFHESGF